VGEKKRRKTPPRKLEEGGPIEVGKASRKGVFVGKDVNVQGTEGTGGKGPQGRQGGGKHKRKKNPGMATWQREPTEDIRTSTKESRQEGVPQPELLSHGQKPERGEIKEKGELSGQEGVVSIEKKTKEIPGLMKSAQGTRRDTSSSRG